MPFLCHRILIGVLIIIWPLAAAAQLEPAQDDTIKTAENAAICGAFAKIMGLQTGLYPKAAKQWHDRHDFAAETVRKIALQNGRQDIGHDDINLIMAQYANWLLGRLTADGRQRDPESYQKTASLIGRKCGKIYHQADLRAIRQLPAHHTSQTKAKKTHGTPPHSHPVIITQTPDIRLQRHQSPLRLKYGNTGYVVDLGSFRDAQAAKRASDQMQHWLRLHNIDIWLHITPVIVDGRLRLRLHSGRLQLDMTNKLCAVAWAAQQACVLTPS